MNSLTKNLNWLRFSFIFLSILDIVLSYVFLTNPDCEMNPLVKNVWHNYGFMGVIFFKIIFSAISIWAAELIPNTLSRIKLYKFTCFILFCTLLLHIVNIIGYYS